MSEFLEVMRERRSANKFIEGVTIPKEDFEDIFQRTFPFPLQRSICSMPSTMLYRMKRL